tara:strand:+ start:282 stop:470 length:189 start_codon:yes stop_codon:yes gene_type:complete
MSTKKRFFKKDLLEQKIIVSIAAINLEDKYKIKTCEIDKLFLGNMRNNKRVGIKYEITDKNA